MKKTARGKLLRTKKKEAYTIAKAEEKGKLQAQIEIEKRTNLPLEIKKLLKKWLEKIDPIEAMAIFGGAIVVHEVIFKTAEFVVSVKDFMENSPFAPFLIPLNVFFFGIFAKPPYTAQPSHPQETQITDDFLLWLVAFGISYYAVRHGGDLLGIANMFFARGSAANPAT